jgi:hypothetical protein
MSTCVVLSVARGIYLGTHLSPLRTPMHTLSLMSTPKYFISVLKISTLKIRMLNISVLR